MTRNVISNALMVFLVLAMSVAIVTPASAQTISADLKEAGAKWHTLVLSEHPYQIFYAIIKNAGTEPVYAKVIFNICDREGIPIGTVITDIVLLPSHPPRAFKLKAKWTTLTLGQFYVSASLHYSADLVNWIEDGMKTFVFTVVP